LTDTTFELRWDTLGALASVRAIMDIVMRCACTRARFAVALGLAPYAFALNPALDINQYAHAAWRIRDGFTRGIIYALAQTPDGYLWLGTEFGLVRFDGVQRTEWTPPAGQQLPSAFIWSLLVTRAGTLWVGTSKGLASWKGGRLTRYPELDGHAIGPLLEDREGSVWAGTFGEPSGRLCAIRNGSVQCSGEDGRFGNGVLSLYQSGGNLWAGASNGLWRWKPDPPKLYPIPGPVLEIHDLIEGESGALWIAMRGGLKRLVNGKAEANPLPRGEPVTPSKLLRDRDGGVWIGTLGQGLLHLHQGRTDAFAWADGLSSDLVYGLFEDREGNIWAATGEGLDRFRDYAVPTISVKQGLSSESPNSVLADRDGSLWLGTKDGLNRWSNGQITIYRKRSLRLRTQPIHRPAVREIDDDGLPDNTLESIVQDDRGQIWVSTPRGVAHLEDGRFIPVGAVASTVVHSITEESAGNVWINDQNLGLFHLLDGRLVEQVPWNRLGRKDYAWAVVPDHVQGGLWLGFDDVLYFKEG